MSRLVLLLFVALAAGCMSGTVRMNPAILRITLTDSPGFVYRAYVLNAFDVGWDLGDRATRERLLRDELPGCRNFEMVDESVIEGRTSPLGRRDLTFVHLIRC